MGQPQKPTAAEQQILSLGRILQSLREEDNVDALIEITISYLKEQFDYSLVWIALYDRLNHILLGRGGIAPGSDARFLQQRLVLSPGDLLEQVVIEQRPVNVADLQAETRTEGWQELAQKFNIQGTLILPIRYKDRCLGLVLLGSQNWGYLLENEAKARLMMVLGELGAVLYQIETDFQHRQTKHSDEPLLKLIENLRILNNLEQKLKAVVQTTHEFVLPSRTNIYWFEPERRYFWLRMSNQLFNLTSSNNQHAVSGMTVQELSDFYYALSVNQIVSIGEGRSSLKSHFTGKLMQRLRVRSLLAAPIILQKDLFGFLSVESKEARIWTEADKTFVKGAAGLISLAVHSEGMEATIQQIQQDAHLTSQVAQSIHNDDDLEAVLRNCAAKVLARFTATRFLLLEYKADKNKYQIFYQSQSHTEKPLTLTLDSLQKDDCQLLQEKKEAVSIENINETSVETQIQSDETWLLLKKVSVDDLQFFNWRSCLAENGVRSLLIANCNQGYMPEWLVIVATENNRCWTSVEKEILAVVSQQLGVTIRQWQLYQQTEQQQEILLSFQQCLSTLEQTQNAKTQPVEQLERVALEQIASVLKCPLVILLSWTPGQNMAQIVPRVITNSRFTIATETPITLQTEELIQSALAMDGLLTLNINDLSTTTKQWLHGEGIGQILVMALRTAADYEPTGVVLMADHPERQWSQQSLSATKTLISQLAWLRRHLQMTQLLLSKTEELQHLNWYKHRRLEDIQRTVSVLLGQLHNLGIPKNELTQMHHQQLLRHLDNTNASMTALLKLEQWHLHTTQETIPMTSLIKRALERVENLLQQKKLWVGVHGLGQQAVVQASHQSHFSERLKYQALTITGDIGKIELVFHELLVAACYRSTGGGRIDIWCRRLNERSIEVSITDNGIIEPQLLADLHQQTPQDVLTPSILDQPPGLHLLICQNLMQKLGGALHFYQLADGRVVSLLLLLAS